MTARILLLALIAVVAGLDLVTKAWALTLPSGGLQVIPGFDLRLGFNTGVSFGLLAAEGVYGYAILLVFTMVVTLFFLWLGWQTRASLERAGYGAIVGGALGNVLDRFPDGAVTDFLDLRAAGWHFPTFNLADVAITTGVGILLLGALKRHA